MFAVRSYTITLISHLLNDTTLALKTIQDIHFLMNRSPSRRGLQRRKSKEGNSMPNTLTSLADEDFCYLTTTGRVSGQPRTIEIWFTIKQRTLYMLAGSGKKAQWVKNLLRTPNVTVRIGTHHFPGRARLVEDENEDRLARQLVVDKYQPRDSDDLSNWGRTALPVAVDL